jgi:PAS domain S-box-containing protein
MVKAEQRKVEEALRKSEQRYRSFIEVTGVLGWTTNAEGEVVEDIPSWRNFTGQTFEEIKGSGWSKALHPDDLENTIRVWEKATEERSKYEVEYRVRRHDGVYRNFLARGAPVFNEDGTVREWVGTCIDITDRIKTEEILRERSLAINSAPDAIFSTDKSFIIRSWNKAAEHMFGWTAEEVIGNLSSSIFNAKYPTLDGTTREDAIKQLVDSGYWKGDIIYHKKDGAPLPVSVSASRLEDRNGNAVGMVVVAHNITEKLKKEEILTEVRRDLTHAQAVAKTGNWRLDTQKNVLVWSKENHRIFGVPEGTPMTYEFFLELVHPDDREYVDRMWKAGLRGEPYDIEHRISVDGEVKWVRERAELEFDEDGTLLGGFGITQDITDLVKVRHKLDFYAKHLEDVVEEKTRQLKDSERLAVIGQTAGMVGHDIRNPLQAMIGELYLAKSELDSFPEGDAKENLKESLIVIEEQVDYVNKIVADLLDFTKPLAPCFEEVDVGQMIRDVLANMGIPDSVELAFSVEESFLKFRTDSNFMKRVMTNLISNAVQAMPTGGKLSVEARVEDGKGIVVVEDTGEGINAEARKRLFEPLFTTRSKGQGFGLPVVKRLVTALNGEVSFESEVGKGTRFVLEIPIEN